MKNLQKLYYLYIYKCDAIKIHDIYKSKRNRSQVIIQQILELYKLQTARSTGVYTYC